MKNYSYIVVEDEDLLRNHLIKKIENLHLPLKLEGSADNGLDGLELAERVSPDLVFLDIMMPVMDGLELAERIHERFPETRMVIVTGYSDFEFARKAIRFGVSEYMLKPIDVKELEAMLDRILERMKRNEQLRNAAYQKEAALRQIATAGNREKRSKEEIADLVEQFLDIHFREEISLSELAERAGFSLDYLSRLFKRYKNESPSRYLTKLRIAEAKELLKANPEIGVREVGELVGYPDPYYFSRVFKEQTSLYPSEYRKTSPASEQQTDRTKD